MLSKLTLLFLITLTFAQSTLNDQEQTTQHDAEEIRQFDNYNLIPPNY